MGDARLTQAPTIAVVVPDPAARFTQAPVIVIVPADPSVGPFRVSQVSLESAQQYTALPVRVSSVLAESTRQYSAVPVRVSSVDLESVQQYSALPVRVSQICIEILRPETCFTVIDSTHVTPTTTTHKIRRLRRTPHLHASMDWLYYDLFEIFLETGIGDTAGSDPQIMLRWSDDGGHTWSNEHWVSAGKLGKYRARAIWQRLGRSRDRVFEVVVDAAARWTMTGARMNVRKGTN